MTTTRDYYIGIDPATISGVAIVLADGTLQSVHSVMTDGFARYIGRWFRPPGSAVIQIEAQHARSVSVATFLAHRGGCIAGALMRDGDTIAPMVYPVTWQMDMLGLSSRDGREAIKRASMAEAGRRWPGMCMTNDESDAALIAEWARTYGGDR